jgi:MAF protein
LGLRFQIVPSIVDETLDQSVDPADLARSLAEAKALDVVRRLAGEPDAATRVIWPDLDTRVIGPNADTGIIGPDALVIGADTIVIIDSEVLGKPADAQEARDMISRLAGRTHRVITGVALSRLSTGETLVEHEETMVWIRPMEPREIVSYVATGEPMDKAGAYAIQGLGSALVYRIDGCYYNVVGLPIPRLVNMLRRFGLDLLSGLNSSRLGGSPSSEERPGGGLE